MGAGTINITRTMDAIARIVAAVSGMDAARVFQGYKRFAEATNLEEDLDDLTAETQGYFAFKFRGKTGGLQAGAFGTPHTFEVIGRLLVKFNKDSDSDLNSAIELADAISDALMDKSNYNSGESYPQTIGYVVAENSVIESQGIMVFSFGDNEGGQMTYYGGC